ncbi:MAG: hypothetical protein C4529_05415 [Deltaproteobacteria bacterium]|nr:MAG: hypothetical protein C4529_05415 [Deltaproteobacteria bacterium]
MNRGIRRPLTICAVVLLVLTIAAYVDARRRDISSIIRTTIDGDTFITDDSPAGDSTMLARELGRWGIALPDHPEIKQESLSSPHPAFSGRLCGAPRPIPPRRPEVPGGLRGDHTLSMEREGNPVDLVFGKIVSRSAVRSTLETGGWECSNPVDGSGAPTVLKRSRGKEVSVVWLDEAKDEFLLVREMGR